MPGQWFSTTNQDLVRYDSLLERDWIIIKDFDPDVTRILEQPFEIDMSRSGPKRAHTPDLLTWDQSGSIVVCDVKPADLSLEPGFQAHVAETKRVCEFLGWDYQLLMEPDPQVLTNLRWLSGYRERPEDFDDDRSKILAALEDGQSRPIDALLSECALPILGRSVLMNLLWDHVAEVDLSVPINPKSLIRKVE